MQISISIFLMLIVVQVTAQITVNNTTFPVIGDTLRYQTDSNPPGLNFGAVGGGNQIWDFTALQGGQIQIVDYLDAASGNGAAYFPTANLRTSNTVRETYFRKTATALENLGTSGADQLNLGLNTSVRYQPPLPERRAPMNFFDIHNLETDLSWAVPTGALADSLLGQLGGLVDSFRFRINTKRLDVVDGWGRCKIPGGEFEVLREKRTQTTKTSIDIHTLLGWVDIGSLFGGGGSGLLGSVGTDTTVAFHFFNHLEKEEIAVLTMNNAGTAVQSVRFKYVPIANAVADFQGQKPTLSISPNPASGFVNLRLKNFSVEDIVLKINDLNGKLLFEKNIYINNGELRIDLTGFPAGHFFIQIFDKNGTRLAARKLLKQV